MFLLLMILLVAEVEKCIDGKQIYVVGDIFDTKMLRGQHGCNWRVRYTTFWRLGEIERDAAS